MPKVICGDCISVLKTLPKESVDCIYTCPAPFKFYEDEITGKIGSETRLNDYINNIQNILISCNDVLKQSGSIFLQIPETWNISGGVFGMPVIIENKIRNLGMYFLRDRLFWHRTENKKKKNNYDYGFLKDYEYIFHMVKDHYKFYFNVKSRFKNTSVFSYPLEDSYYTNEFDSGLPTELFKMVIDTSCPKNGTVLDPLAGSGKLGVVAKQMNRDYILIDISESLCDMMRTRLKL